MTTNNSGQKYILKRDMRMPSNAPFGARAGEVVPAGTVFYKEGSGFRAWFHTGPERLALDDQDFIVECDEPPQAGV